MNISRRFLDHHKNSFHASSNDTERMVMALEDSGVILVRGLIPNEIISEIRTEVVEFFNIIEQQRDSAVTNFQRTFGNLRFEDQMAYGEGKVIYALHYLTKSKISSTIFDYLQTSKITTPMGYDFVRKHGPRDTKSISPFHQDARAVPVGTKMLTCWIPLDCCGYDAPGLELLPKKLEENIPITKCPLTNHSKSEIDPKYVRSLNETGLWRPLFEAGDLMIFDGKTIHRTYLTDNMTKMRHSIEIRFFDRSCAEGEWLDKRYDSRLPSFVRCV